MPGKQGGFFKRLKQKQVQQTKKSRRGTTGLNKADRVKKKNALADIYTAQRQLRELKAEIADRDAEAEAIPTSDDDDNASHASSSDAGNQAAHTLRAMLGVRPNSLVQDDVDNSSYDDDDDDEEEGHDGGEEDGSSHEDAVVGNDDPDDAVELQHCALCTAPLLGESVEGGVACPECKQCYCADCHNGTHASLGHAVVSLAELDAQEEEEDEDLNDAAEDDEEEDGINAELVGEGDDEEEDEDDEEEDDDDNELAYEEEDGEAAATIAEGNAKAFLPAFSFAPTSGSADIVAHAVPTADPWFKLYVAGKRIAPLSSSQQQKESAVCVSEGDVPVFSPLAAAQAPDEVQLVAGSTVATWAKRVPTNHGLSPDARPSFVLPFVWSKWCAYKAQCSPDEPPLTATSFAKLVLLSTYSDVNASTRTWSTEPEWIDAVVLHLLNHWAKASAAMTAHDEALRHHRRRHRRPEATKGSRRKKHRSEDSVAAGTAQQRDEDDKIDNESEDDGANGSEDEPELRDRGFAKTRLLLVLPMRNLALKYIKVLREVLGLGDTVARHRYDKFEYDFSGDPEEERTLRRRPEDFRKQFSGNIDDSFCVGVHMRTTGISVYSHVLNADLIVCSPLGLRKRLSREADILVSLSSIEVAVVDQADVLLLQNWEHAQELFGLINKLPSDTTEGLSDLRRVYPWALEGRAEAYRQTVLCSSFPHAVFNAYLRGTSVHLAPLRPPTAVLHVKNTNGVLPQIQHGVRQHYARFQAATAEAVDDARLAFFKEQLYPTKLKQLVERNVRTILYVPSYFDFLRLRVFLDEQLRGSFAEVTEYSSERAQRKALGQFSALERPLLVLTERFVFYRRFQIKHAEALVFYSPPLMKQFYSSMVNQLVADSPNATVLCGFCKYDALELRRLVGTQRGNHALTAAAPSYVFVSTNRR